MSIEQWRYNDEHGKRKKFQEEAAQVTIHSPRASHEVTRDSTRVSVVVSQRLDMVSQCS
jgi:hypothetical protein